MQATLAREDLACQTACQALAWLRAGEATSVELIEMLLARIEQHNPALNAIVSLDAEAARQRAKAADEASRRGESWGPLHGLPITVKDTFETAGLRTVAGYPPFWNRIPARDAPPVARLRQAGAILLGKSNTPPLARGNFTDNPVFGRTNNPWDLGRSPGRSSGGAAAAIAAGLAYLELGSDIGGSVRHPAHFCGIYSLKTTSGRVSGRGHLASARPLALRPRYEALLQLASFGPLARSVADLRLALPVIAEPGTPNLDGPPARALPELRIAWTDEFGGVPLTQDSRRAIQQLAGALEAAGCRVERQDRAGFDYDEAWHAAGVCLGAVDTLLQPPLARLGRRLASPFVARGAGRGPLLHGLVAGTSLRPQLIRQALERRTHLIERLEAFLEGWDAWICPAFPTPAFTHRGPNAPIEVDGRPMPQLAANLLHSVIFNLTGHPVVTIPVGHSSTGLPIGVQLVGCLWREMDLLNVAEAAAGVTRGYQRPPDYRKTL
jgi:amidase